MASPAPSFMTASLAWEPEPLPVSPHLETADALAVVPADPHRRPLDVAQCSLCGIALPLGLLVPDGGEACTDVRWYCKDAKGCTERWTSASRGPRALPAPVQSVA
jgi:hypothetical protein